MLSGGSVGILLFQSGRNLRESECGRRAEATRRRQPRPRPSERLGKIEGTTVTSASAAGAGDDGARAAREQRARRGKRFERERYGPNPTTTSGHRFHASPRATLHAFLLDQLPEINDERSEAVEKRARRCALPSSGRRCRRRSVDPCGPLRASRRALRHGPAERTCRCPRGRNVEHAVSVANHVCEHFAMCSEPT